MPHSLLDHLSVEMKVLTQLFSGVSEHFSDQQRLSFSYQDFLNLLERHQIKLALPPVMSRLQGMISDDNYQELYEKVQRESFQQLHLAKELLSLLEEFKEAGIDVISFKGPSLSYELYDSFGLKSSVDLDLLVKAEDILKAERMILARKYKAEKYHFNRFSILQWKLFRAFNYHGGYVNLESRTKTELHWKFFAADSAFPKSVEKTFQSASLATVNGTPMLRLSMEDLIVYLSMHGMIHLWVRLKWLMDIRGFMIKYGAITDWVRVLEMCENSKLTRAVLVAIHLSNILFKTPIPPGFEWKADDVRLSKLMDLSTKALLDDFRPASREQFGQVMILVKGDIFTQIKYKGLHIPYLISRPFVSFLKVKA